MRTQRVGGRWLPVALILGVATVAAAQRFVWPPASGDRGEQPVMTAPDPVMAVADDIAAAPLSVAARPAAYGQAQPVPVVAPAPESGNRLDWRILENPNGPHTALIFDPVRQVFAVYHVDSASGEIMLKSVRGLSADLMLEQFNSSTPAPKDIRAMLDEAR